MAESSSVPRISGISTSEITRSKGVASTAASADDGEVSGVTA
jgi:hypothetical protein